MMRGVNLPLGGERMRDKAVVLGAPLACLIAAVALFAQFGVYGQLDRDEAIYAYGGQQLAHGVAPYASIFDPKTPGATFLAGVAAAVARAYGGDSLWAI